MSAPAPSSSSPSSLAELQEMIEQLRLQSEKEKEQLRLQSEKEKEQLRLENEKLRLQSEKDKQEKEQSEKKLVEVEKKLENATKEKEQERHEKEQEKHAKEQLILANETKKNQLFREAFPPLLTPSYKKSLPSSSINTRHEKIASISTATSFGILSEQSMAPLLSPDGSRVWGSCAPGTKHLTAWATESDVQTRVVMALEDILRNCRLALNLHVLSQLSVVDHRPDIWVLRSTTGIPVGVCEVKKPTGCSSELSESGIANEHLFGQIFDYMIELRNFYGLRDVFGIVTTYQKWRICWLPDTNDVAQVQSFEQDDETLKERIPIDPDISQKRHLHVSSIYSHDQPELIYALITVMHKMYRSHSSPRSQLVEQNKFYILLNQTNWRWEKIPKTTTKLSYAMPPDSITKFFLLQDYHGGADGRVWLAMSHQGQLVVIKFMTPQTGDEYSPGSMQNLDLTERINNEVAVWNHVWKVSARKITLYGRPAILMPFVFHCRLTKQGLMFNRPNRWNPLLANGSCKANEDQVPIDDLLESDSLYTEDRMKAIAKQAISTMLNHGYEHDDMAWRHVALMPVMVKKYPVEWQLQEILIDFSRVTKLSDGTTEQEKAKKCEQFLEKLQVELEQSRSQE